MLDVEKFCEPKELYTECKVLDIPTPTITQTVPIIQPVVQKIVVPANAKKQVNKLRFYYFSEYKNMIVDNSEGCGSAFLLTKEGHIVICHHYVVHEAEFTQKERKGWRSDSTKAFGRKTKPLANIMLASFQADVGGTAYKAKLLVSVEDADMVVMNPARVRDQNPPAWGISATLWANRGLNLPSDGGQYQGPLSTWKI